MTEALCELLTAFKTAKLAEQWSGSALPSHATVTQSFASVARRSADVSTRMLVGGSACKAALIADFDESRRPYVPKILRLEAWFKILFTFYMFRTIKCLCMGNACCSFCHLLTGPPHRRQHGVGVRLGRGLGMHRAWSGFYRRDVRLRDHPCQDLEEIRRQLVQHG